MKLLSAIFSFEISKLAPFESGCIMLRKDHNSYKTQVYADPLIIEKIDEEDFRRDIGQLYKKHANKVKEEISRDQIIPDMEELNTPKKNTNQDKNDYRRNIEKLLSKRGKKKKRRP